MSLTCTRALFLIWLYRVLTCGDKYMSNIKLSYKKKELKLSKCDLTVQTNDMVLQSTPFTANTLWTAVSVLTTCTCWTVGTCLTKPPATPDKYIYFFSVRKSYVNHVMNFSIFPANSDELMCCKTWASFSYENKCYSPAQIGPYWEKLCSLS